MRKCKGIFIIMLAVCVSVFSMAFAACGPSEPETPEKTVTSLTVSKLPDKTEYMVGDTFSAAGGELAVKYDDGTEETVSMTAEGVEITLPDLVTVPDDDEDGEVNKNVAVRYGGKTVNFNVKLSVYKYTVTFVLGGGADDIVQTVRSGSTAEKPADPTRDDYTFNGWYTDTGYLTAFDFDTQITENTTVYAQWLEAGVYYDFTFDYNYYGCKPDGVTTQIKEDETVTSKPADPTREGYEFTGWYTAAEGGAEYNFDTPVTADTTIYAQWNKTHSGQKTYTFEAEDVNLSGKRGPTFSGTVNDKSMVVYKADRNASGNRYVGYLYYSGGQSYIDFHIVSDIAVSDVTFTASFSAEMRDMSITDEEFRITVNGNKCSYGSISFTGVPEYDYAKPDCLNFSEFTISTSVSLVAGDNVIRMQTNNNTPLDGSTVEAKAPLVDCIRLTATDAVLTWDENYAPTTPNYRG